MSGSRRRSLRASLLALGFLLVTANLASAQRDERPFTDPKPPKYWGVQVAYTPLWMTPESPAWANDIACVFLVAYGCDDVSLKGSEFRIGLVRGRSRRWTWGLFYVQKQISDAAAVNYGYDCPGSEAAAPALGRPNGCYAYNNGRFYYFRGATLSGAEFQWSKPVANIGRHVQLGVTLAGGVGTITGEAEGLASDYYNSCQQDVPLAYCTVPFRSDVRKNDLVMEVQFLGRFDLDVNVPVGRGLTVKGSTGVDFFGARLATVSLVYLFNEQP